MPENNYAEIIEKYVEMNIVHSIQRRYWTQHTNLAGFDLEKNLGKMERIPENDLEIRFLLKETLTDKLVDREIFMKGIDTSYFY